MIEKNVTEPSSEVRARALMLLTDALAVAGHETPKDAAYHVAPIVLGGATRELGVGSHQPLLGGVAESPRLRLRAGRALVRLHDLVRDEVLGVRLLSAVHHVLGEV